MPRAPKAPNCIVTIKLRVTGDNSPCPGGGPVSVYPACLSAGQDHTGCLE